MWTEKRGKINRPQKESLSVVLSDAKRLHSLIESMLDISRIEGRRIKYDFTRLNILNAVKASVKTAQVLAKQKSITIVVKGKPIYVLADKVRIGQTIVNLITNAIKYGKENGGQEVRLM